MVRGYTNTTTVSEFIRTDITSGSIPNISTVNTWIEWAEDQIDRKVGSQFTTSTASTVYLSSNGGTDFWYPKQYLPVVSIQSLEINSGTDFDPTWDTKVEGTDFLILDLNSGHIRFEPGVQGITDSVLAREKFETGLARKVRSNITYGYDSIPAIVEELATRLAAKEYLQSGLSNVSVGGNESIKVGPIEIKDGTKDSLTYVRNLNNEIKDLFRDLGVMKTYIY